MSRWPSVSELMEHASPEARRNIEAASAQLGRARSVLPAPLAASIQVEKRGTPVAGPVMNKTETRYAQRLVAEGFKPRFAALTLCLTSYPGRRVRYTPDFVVVRGGVLELHEVKGAHVYEDGALKFQFAVEEWGGEYTFVWAQWAHGEWSIRRYERRNPVAG